MSTRMPFDTELTLLLASIEGDEFAYYALEQYYKDKEDETSNNKHTD